MSSETLLPTALSPPTCPSPQMPEEEAFCVFVRLMQEYRLRELFKPSMAELGLCIYQFEYMLQVSRATGGQGRRRAGPQVSRAIGGQGRR